MQNLLQLFKDIATCEIKDAKTIEIIAGCSSPSTKTMIETFITSLRNEKSFISCSSPSTKTMIETNKAPNPYGARLSFYCCSSLLPKQWLKLFTKFFSNFIPVIVAAALLPKQWLKRWKNSFYVYVLYMVAAALLPKQWLKLLRT